MVEHLPLFFEFLMLKNSSCGSGIQLELESIRSDHFFTPSTLDLTDIQTI